MIARKFAVVLASLSVFIGASGCSVLPFDNKPTPTVTAPVGDELSFLKLVRDEYPDLMLQSDQMLISLVKSVCGALDRGATKDDIMKSLQNSTSDQKILDEMAFVIGAGIPVFCPQHIDKMRA